MSFNLPKKEEEILDFWRKKDIFQKSLEKRKDQERFVFYEGPPFANGLPGIHHLVARAFKDIILRYKTMKGFFVGRRAGWDTHGLPTEMAAEKKLGIETKKDIEKIGIDKFIKESRDNVFNYKKEWEQFSERIGFWLDFDKAYITCNKDYIESLWWILKQIWDKGLLYQDYNVVPYCSRCGTSLSSHEVAQGYKKVTENSITVKFELEEEKGVYLLVWTTTPWTLPGNVALAVNPDIDYVKFSLKGHEGISDGTYICSEKDFEDYPKDKAEIIEEFKGKDLIGKKYIPLYENEAPYLVVGADFVSVEEGTGIVHMAPAFGEDDMKVARENDLPVLMTVDEEGKMKTEGYSWEGMFVKKADSLIVEDLKKRDFLFKEEDYEHDYPFCWRCKTPLLYYAKNSWFIKISEIKDKLIENNKEINWVPSHIKEGRFGEWLKEIKDWNLSRERYWGTPLPIWECSKCGKKVCIGSLKELKEKSGEDVEDLHRPFVDKITFKCECGGEMKRVPEVIDCWFDSGSMPFAQWHYPFENKERIDKGELFPADFIAEGIDQTRGWFYTLLAISTLLDKGISYKNVVVLGLVLDSKGQKMSKSRGNIVVPKEVIDKFGADCARMYFYTVNPVSETKSFDFKDVQTLYRRFFNTLHQSYNFFSMYKGSLKEAPSENVLDKWIVSRLESLNKEIVDNLENYNIVAAARPLLSFVDDLSNWYIRRSRQRFRDSDEGAVSTLYYVLKKLSLLLAPFTPFLAEYLYLELGGKEESVHLEDYPSAGKTDKKLEERMKKVRDITAQALALRSKAGIKTRQPLKKLVIKEKLEDDLLELIKEEVNVKKVISGEKLELDTEITEELKKEGQKREFLRNVKSLRKKMKLNPQDKASQLLTTFSDIVYEGLKEDAGVKEVKVVDKIEEKTKKEIDVGGKKEYIAIKK